MSDILYFPQEFLKRSLLLAEIKDAQDAGSSEKTNRLRLMRALDKGCFTKNELVRSIYVGSSDFEASLAQFIADTAVFRKGSELDRIGSGDFEIAKQHYPDITAQLIQAAQQTSFLIADRLVGSHYKLRTETQAVQRLRDYQNCLTYIHIPTWMGSVVGYTVLAAAARTILEFVGTSPEDGAELGDSAYSVFQLDIGELAEMAPKQRGAFLMSSDQFVFTHEQAVRAGFLVVTGFRSDTLSKHGTLVYSLLSAILKERQDAGSQLNKNTGAAIITAIPPTASAFFAEFEQEPLFMADDELALTVKELKKQLRPFFENAISGDDVKTALSNTKSEEKA